jgi:GT2 family glycosyltransferase/tetratricopeptide (TPR) repeat protein
MLKEAGYLEAAVNAYRAAVTWDGTAADAYVHLGHVLKRLGRIDEAIDAFRAVEAIPYGPHVRPEINGLIVAQLNANHARQNRDGDTLDAMPEALRQRDEALHAWLQEEQSRRYAHKPGAIKGWRGYLPSLRRRLRSIAEPMSDLVTDAEGYRATSNNPRMRLLTSRSTQLQDLRGQWIEICLKIVSAECVVDLILYAEEAPGWARFKIVRLVKRTDSSFSAIVRLPQSLVSLRLDPVHSPGKFQLWDLQLHRLSTAVVIGRMLREPDGAGLAALVKGLRQGKLLAAAEELLTPAMADDYARWIAFHERQSPPGALPDAGSIGFVMSISSADGSLYASSLASLKEQTSPRWKLVVVLDDGIPVSLCKAIELEASKDDRVRISVATSAAAPILSAMKDIAADLIGLLPAGDVLAPSAVASFLSLLAESPSLKVIYCDHDEIDDRGRRHSPCFKPDWNPDYILCYDYVGPSVVFSTTAINAVGGFRDRFPGQETFDLLLRTSNDAKEGEIAHLAKPLWHSCSSQKDRSVAAIVNNFLAHISSPLRAEPGRVESTARLVWPMPEKPPHVSIIIPTRDRIDLLRTAIASIISRTDYPSFDIVVVDNGSVEIESKAYFSEIVRTGPVSILRDDGPFNFSRLNNRAAEIAKGPLLALVNNDVEVKDGRWLKEMVPIALDPTVGAVGAKLLYGSGHIQHAGIIGGIGTVAGHGHKYEPESSKGYMNRLIVHQTVIAVTAACLLLEASKFEEVGGLNEENLSVAFNDVDLCLKLKRRGWRTVLNPWVELFHHESLSRGPDVGGERAIRFKREADYMVYEWGKELLDDPFYSINLSRDFEDFSYR